LSDEEIASLREQLRMIADIAIDTALDENSNDG